MNNRASRAVYAVDVGSTRARRGGDAGFAWARLRDDGGIDGRVSIAGLVTSVTEHLRSGHSVALGFEAPLAIPVPVDDRMLSHSRSNENNRSWAAPVGLTVSTLGLHQSAWILSAVRSALGSEAKHIAFAHEADAWPAGQRTLFCWEAFVSGSAHGDHHIQDAATAVSAFVSAEADLVGATRVRADRPLSLIATAALWSGWLVDAAWLHTQSAVIQPMTRYTGVIESS